MSALIHIKCPNRDPTHNHCFCNPDGLRETLQSSHRRSPESKIKGARKVSICFPAQQRQPLKEGPWSSVPLMIVCVQSSCLLQTPLIYLHFSCVGKHQQWLWDLFTNADWTAYLASGYPSAASAVGMSETALTQNNISFDGSGVAEVEILPSHAFTL